MKRRINGLISYFKGAGEDVFPSIINPKPEDKVIRVPMSDYQFNEYQGARSIEREKEQNSSKKKGKVKSKPDSFKKLGKQTSTESVTKNDLFKNTSYYRTFSRQRCNFVFPREIDRPLKTKIEEIINNTDLNNKQENEIAENAMESSLELAMKELEVNKEQYLTKEQLVQLSPKFLRILENIEKSPGSVLVYSSFKSCEGLGVLSLVLEAHGFVKYKFKKEGKNYILDIKDEDLDKPKYLSYSGDETEEVKRLLMQAFNSRENLYGEKIKVFLSSPSGAEGISLANVRQVNIIEPYWHNVRLEQVMGRAVRICSHINLPKKDQTVEIFIYISEFTKKQINSNATIQFQDDSKTTDEYILNIANKKQLIMDRMYTLMKEASIDCVINKDEHKHEKLDCLNFGNKVTLENYTYIPNLYEEVLDKDRKKVEKRSVVQAKEIIIKDTKYMVGKDKSTIYDYDSWKSGKTFEIGKIIDRKLILFVGPDILDIQDESHRNLYYNTKTKEVFNNSGKILNKFKTLKYKGINYFLDIKKKVIYDCNDLLSNKLLNKKGEVFITATNTVLVGNNIIECNDENDTILYFNKDNKTIYDTDGKKIMKLTSTKYKENEYFYDKDTNIVYNKDSLINNGQLIDSGKVSIVSI